MQKDKTSSGSSEAVEQAAAKIRTILAGEGVTVGTLDQAAVAEIAEIIDVEVKATGGNATALFAVTSSLTHLVPAGARRLRGFYWAFKKSRILERAAIGIFSFLQGDPEAETVEIGRRVHGTIELFGGSFFTATVLEGLSAILVGVSPQKLAKYRDSYFVADLGGEELARLVPNICSPNILICLAPIMKAKNIMPWRKKDKILKAAGKIAQQGLQGRKAAALVNFILEEDDGESTAPIITAAWHYPEKPAHEKAA